MPHSKEIMKKLMMKMKHRILKSRILNKKMNKKTNKQMKSQMGGVNLQKDGGKTLMENGMAQKIITLMKLTGGIRKNTSDN